jgi:hypothetical protein
MLRAFFVFFTPSVSKQYNPVCDFLSKNTPSFILTPAKLEKQLLSRALLHPVPRSVFPAPDPRLPAPTRPERFLFFLPHLSRIDSFQIEISEEKRTSLSVEFEN